MQTTIRLAPGVYIVNPCGWGTYKVRQGDGDSAFLHKTIVRGFATQGQAIMWAVDNSFATVEGS